MAMVPWRKKGSWDPLESVENLHKELSNWLGFPASADEDSLIAAGSGWAPAIDIQDKKDKVVVKAELPGMKKEDVKLSIEDDYLIIEGEKKHEEEKEDKETGYYRRECSYGSFQRAVNLPVGVDTEKADAKYKDGVLKITLPKKEEEKRKTKKIDIK